MTRRPNPARRARDWLFTECMNGRRPAEELCTEDRALLVERLWKRGWTDAEIAAFTLMSTYTTARIRSRLKLSPHRPVEGAA